LDKSPGGYETMSIFGRRRLQRMLDDLGPWLAAAKKGKAKAVLNSLESNDPDQSLPAQYELTLTWCVSRIASLEIEKRIGAKRPDIYSEDFLPGGPMVADIAAISDIALSGEGVMMDARKIINKQCNGIIKEAENHLHYTFMEESGYLPANHPDKSHNRYFRRRKITRAFKMDSTFDAALRDWLGAGPPKQKLRWQGEHIDVVIEWRSDVHPLSSIFCTMPSESYDLKKNRLYEVLESKREKMKGASEGVQRAILLGDAGCSLLRNLRPFGQMFDTVSGQQIILSFLAEPDNTVDFVVVFSPKRTNENSCAGSKNPRIWHFDFFHHCAVPPEAEIDRFRLLKETLPVPYLDGYQARSWCQQGMSNPKTRRDYLCLEWSEGSRHMTVKLSARSLQDLIAGRLNGEKFELWVTGKPNPFALALEQGLTISAVRFEAQGTDEDDDYVVFEFSDDPAARELRLPASVKSPLP
jgi:hypothetical protein